VPCFESTTSAANLEFGNSGGCTAEAYFSGRRTFQPLAYETLGDIATVKGLYSAAFFDLDHDVCHVEWIQRETKVRVLFASFLFFIFSISLLIQ
jgi:hypothetical protein